MKKITIVTTKTCPRCHHVKAYLREMCEKRGIAYTEYIIPDPEAMKLVKEFSVTSAPFILYEDGEIRTPYKHVLDNHEVDHLFNNID